MVVWQQTPSDFNNVTEVVVDKPVLGLVYVLREGEYIPMWNSPNIINGKMKFTFFKEETGLIY